MGCGEHRPEHAGEISQSSPTLDILVQSSIVSTPILSRPEDQAAMRSAQDSGSNYSPLIKYC